MATLDVPEQNRLAETVVRGLSKGAGARDGAAAIVEPISRDVPAGNFSHERPPFAHPDNMTPTPVVPLAAYVGSGSCGRRRLGKNFLSCCSIGRVRSCVR